jgi:acetyl-CoA carboxylase carboxyltransferase component
MVVRSEIHGYVTAPTYIPQNAGERPQMRLTIDDPYRMVNEVWTILPQQKNRVYNMKKIIEVLADEERKKLLEHWSFDSFPYKALN